jgi:hypothetical protein
MDRRHHERHPIDWAAGYRLEGTGDWLPCRAVNLGSGGIAIEAPGLSGGEYLLGDIEVRFELAGTDTFELLGAVRHRARSHRGGVLLGIEFVDLTPEMFEILATLRTTSAALV